MCKQIKITYIIIIFTVNRYTKTASSLVEEACLNTCNHVVCDNVDLDTILIEYENYYFLRYQKKPKISKPLDVAKTATTHTTDTTHTSKNAKNKMTKKANSSQFSREVQSLDTSFITVTPMNNNIPCGETLESEFSFPTVDLSHWKDEWQVYAEIISKVNTVNTFLLVARTYRAMGVFTTDIWRGWKNSDNFFFLI